MRGRRWRSHIRHDTWDRGLRWMNHPGTTKAQTDLPKEDVKFSFLYAQVWIHIRSETGGRFATPDIQEYEDYYKEDDG